MVQGIQCKINYDILFLVPTIYKKVEFCTLIPMPTRLLISVGQPSDSLHCQGFVMTLQIQAVALGVGLLLLDDC